MHHARTCLLALAVVAMLSACDGGTGEDPTVSDTDAPGAVAGHGDESVATPDAGGGDAAAAAAPAGAGDVLLDKEGAPVAMVAFDRDDVPEAATAPGALPVFSLPRGYTTREGPQVLAFSRFPFRLGDGLHWVEGASWSTRIGVDDDAFPDKDYSPLEVRLNLEAVLEQAGAKRVFEGPLQRDLYYGTLDDEIGDGFIEAVNYGADTPTSVYVIRHGGRTVWIQLAFDSHATGVMVVEERPFVATARWSDEFPHLSLPAGYELRNHELRRDYDVFPFWTGAAFEDIEGRAYAADFGAGEDTYSMHEVRRNLQAMMDAAGGVLVHAGPVPKDASESIPSERKSPYGNAAGYSWHEDDRSTWRVDLDDGRQVWIHARLDPRAAGWVVVERQELEQTSTVPGADAPKAKSDAERGAAATVPPAA